MHSTEQEIHAYGSSTDSGGYLNNDVQLLEVQDDSCAHASEDIMQHEDNNQSHGAPTSSSADNTLTPRIVSTPLGTTTKPFEDTINGQSSVNQQEEANNTSKFTRRNFFRFDK